MVCLSTRARRSVLSLSPFGQVWSNNGMHTTRISVLLIKNLALAMLNARRVMSDVRLFPGIRLFSYRKVLS